MDLNPEPLDAPKQDRKTWWATLFLLCAILGAMLGLSVRTQQVVRNTVAATSASISQKQVDDLQRTIKAQQDRVATLEQAIAGGTGQKQALLDDLKSAKFAAGLTSVQGPGVVVTLNDSKKPYTGMLPPGFAPPNIIHDTDINSVINELKQAGAEVVSINDQRLVATSAVRCAGPTVYVNNTQEATPFVIKAIGDAKTLQSALNIPGGEADSINHFDKDMLSIQVSKHLVVPAYSGVIQPKYAVPVPVSPDKNAGA